MGECVNMHNPNCRTHAGCDGFCGVLMVLLCGMGHETIRAMAESLYNEPNPCWHMEAVR